ncbi:Peptidase A1 [Corchorus olitorius]|uniref:Peptidase A1 n=1 Tax=Corchorus olitorius TaxID=93759 RepID=A0A1R3KBR4_9ROSI|nr:Peptidase A1 [Corchorus olitorius]
MSLALYFILITLLSQLHFAFSDSPNPLGLSIRATIDDSPGSPLYQIENLTIAGRVERLINISNARVNYLNSNLHKNAKPNPDNIRIGIYRDFLFYAVGFTIGSQQHPVKLLLDTGGGLIWTQCQPCSHTCFPQRLPMFDPRLSSTYSKLPCSHQFCQGPNRIYDCVSGQCVYNVSYCGGSWTAGIASFESFQFPMSSGHMGSFNNIIFGCSYQSSDFAFKNNEISGIFGLGMSPDSMVTQFAPVIQSRFSYCLIPFPDAMPRPLILRFGEDIPQRPHLQSALMWQVQLSPIFYYLELLDITVANHRIGFHPDTFRIRPDGSGGLFIDSGALFSFIDTNTVGINAYETVMQVYQAYYGSRGLRRIRGTLGFELCYETPPSYRDYASITFHLNGADYTVPGIYGHFTLSGHGFCVAIIKGTASILGAWHQQNKRIIYDRNRALIQFGDEQCVNDVL